MEAEEVAFAPGLFTLSVAKESGIHSIDLSPRDGIDPEEY